ARAYRAETVREPILAGTSYPAEREDLERFLGGHLAEARAIRMAGTSPAPPADPAAVAVPHLDLKRAGATIGLGFLPLSQSPRPHPVVLFGTGHALYETVLAITDKTIRTPLGDLATDRDAVARVAERAGDGVFDEETAFRSEHSIEFPALYLQY